MNVAKGALMEIASRLRDRILRPANAAAHPGPIGHFQGFPTPANFSVRGPMPSGMIGSGSSGGYDHFKVSCLVELYRMSDMHNLRTSPVYS